jgi:hypothetical protein
VIPLPQVPPAPFSTPRSRSAWRSISMPRIQAKRMTARQYLLGARMQAALVHNCKSAGMHKSHVAKLHLFKKRNQAQLQHGTSAIVRLCTIAKLHKGQT